MRNVLESEEERSCVDGVYTHEGDQTDEQRLYQRRKRMLLMKIFYIALFSALEQTDCARM